MKDIETDRPEQNKRDNQTSHQPNGQETRSQTSLDIELLGRLWPYVSPDRWYIFFSLLVTPLVMLTVLLQPWLLKIAIDDYIAIGKLQGLQWIAGLYLAVIVGNYVLEGAYSLALSISGQRTIQRLREKIYRHLMSLSPSFFNKHPAGALLTRGTSDVEALGETLTAGVVTILLDILMMLGILVVMFWLDWRLTLILLVIAPPLMWVLAFCRRNLRFYFLQSRESLALVNATLAERIAGVQIVQLFNHHRQTQDIFVAHNEQLRDANIRSNFYDALMYAFVDGVSSICIALILWYATRDWFGTAVTVGLLVAFIEYLQRLFRPIQEFAIKIAIIQRAATALTKIFGLLDNREMIEQGQIKPPQHRGHIVMSDVYFAYRDRDILRGISAEIKPGEVVAIVGATGCGKTTLTRLLTRSYDNYRGSIQIDGCELSQLDLDKLRELIAVVPQDIHLFSDTVAFNIGLNHPQIDLNSIQQAAALVHADSFIADLPDTWQHTLRERGSNLSLGQGQLLTFARTMAYNPEIIILDEATASIDSQTEALIQDAIIRIFQRKTAIVIAHRLSTIMSADRILVMKEGQIAEHGTHDQLMQRDGLYAQLFRKGFNQSSPQ